MSSKTRKIQKKTEVEKAKAVLQAEVKGRLERSQKILNDAIERIRKEENCMVTQRGVFVGNQMKAEIIIVDK